MTRRTEGLHAGTYFPTNYKSAIAAAGLLLDSYTTGLTGVFSTRKLLTAYAGSALRVRRSSDDTEQDIGFSSNLLDTVALAAFVGANNGFVTKWYDQSGSARDISQGAGVRQPRIVSSGTIDTVNSFPAMLFDGSLTWLDYSANISDFITTTAYSFYGLVKTVAFNNAFGSSADGIFGDQATFVRTLCVGTTDKIGAVLFEGGYQTASATQATGAAVVGVSILGSGTLSAYANGGTPGTTSVGTIGSVGSPARIGNTGGLYNGYMNELIVYNAAQAQATSNAIGASMATRAGTSWTNI